VRLHYRDFLNCIDYPYEWEEWQIRFAEKKLDLINRPIDQREALDMRTRGGSKTLDMMIFNIYLAYVGFNGVWFSAGQDQLEQPKKYLEDIIGDSFLSKILRHQMTRFIAFEGGGTLWLKNLTPKKARSARGDYVTYDEEAQAEEAAYNAGKGILSASDLAIKNHISTPVKGSIFEKNYDRLKLKEIITGEQFIFKRQWQEIEFLAKNREFYEEEKKTLPGWFYRQEYECSFELPLGAVFQNVQYGAYPDWLLQKISDQPLLSGLDWNPVAGHMLVSIKWTKDLTNAVVMDEINLGQGYAVQMTNQQWDTIKRKASHGNHLNYECSGINEEYVRWVQKKKSETMFNYPDQNWHSEEWDSAGVNKLKIATFIIQNGVCIYVDKIRFPEVAKQIEDCQWDPESPTPKLKKDAASSPHYLDAFLHAASEENRRETRFTFGEWK